jgi:predicted histidine transporter YuiF (NhaC family)
VKTLLIILSSITVFIILFMGIFFIYKQYRNYNDNKKDYDMLYKRLLDEKKYLEEKYLIKIIIVRL